MSVSLCTKRGFAEGAGKSSLINKKRSTNTMTTSITASSLIEETKDFLRETRVSLMHVARNLHAIKAGEEWKSLVSNDNWGQFCESELGISPSMASKLMNTYQHFVIEGGIPENQLMGIDHDKLNSARSLPGTPEEQLSKATHLSRTELKQEKNDAEATPHTPSFSEVCTVCWLAKSNHPL